MTCLTVLMSQHALALTSVSASVDKNPVSIKESIVLTVVANDDVNANALDTSSLLKDFIVGRTSVSTQTSMINFKTSRTTRWSTVLIARKTGKVTIPSLSIENQQTQAIDITVLAANDSKASKQQDIFITNEISSTDIYVQQLLTLSVKLHFSAELKRGSLSEPSLLGANIVQIDKDQESEQIINGKRFRVIERLYAINPQKSGDFTILSSRFSGEIMMPSARRSNFLSFAETKPVSVVGDDIKITVRPIPVTYQGKWLPSEIITLHQDWQPDLSNFKVGEPITRTITLTAAGLSKEQLPKIAIDVPKGLKVYPDQAELHSSLTKDRLVSQQVQNFAIVASRAGNYKLPAITIPWFNTVTNKIEQAQIPAQQITVNANTDFPEDPLVIGNENNANATPLTPETNKQANSNVIVQNSWLQWLFLTLWLLTSIGWAISAYFTKHKYGHLINKKLSDNSLSVTNNNNCYTALINSCKNNQAEETLSLLIPWANTLVDKNQTVVGLVDAIKVIADESFESEITNLQQSLYSKAANDNQISWNGKSLLNLVKSINKQGLKKSNSTRFNLNP